MPDYKQRKIELTPKRYEDGTWHCLYRIIEFRATCWGYHKGSPRGIFASRDAAAAAALAEAKRIVDSLEPPPQGPPSIPGTVLRTYEHTVRRLFARPRR